MYKVFIQTRKQQVKEGIKNTIQIYEARNVAFFGVS
jgi:hypothetical protein